MQNLMSFSVLALCSLAACQYSTPKGKGPVNEMPILGLGTFGIGGWALGKDNNMTLQSIARNVVKMGLSKGFRLLDAATIYGNEKGVGFGLNAALADGIVKREDIWITTKLWSSNHQNPEAGLRGSLRNLNVSYIDLYLMHFPFGITFGEREFDHVETWQKMQRLVYPGGPVRHIGVSNFSPKQMNDILQLPGPRPYAHQFEMHPYLQQSAFVKWHIDNGIRMTAYAPLANTSPSYKSNFDRRIPLLLENPELNAIAKLRGCGSAAQVALAWNIKRGVAVIPKAAKEEHQEENLNVESCKLIEEDVGTIEKFTTEKKWVGRMNNPCKQYMMPCYRGLEEADGGDWRNPDKQV